MSLFAESPQSTGKLGNVTARGNSLVALGRCVLHRGSRVVWLGLLSQLPTDVFYDGITLHPDDFDQLTRSFHERA